ncbi:MAG: DMT family transporter [Pseudomonadota bacterium]
MSLAGVSAALATVLIWASFLVTLRFAMTNDFSQGAVLIMRFLPAAVVLAPVIMRTGLRPVGVPTWQLAIIVLGSGVPFYYLISLGLSFSSASDAGALAPGTLPLLIAVASFLLLGERFSSFRLIGFGMILSGGMMIGLWEAITAGEDGAWQGHILIVTAVCGWALYTVVFRLSGLGALEGAAISIAWSSIIVVPVGFGLGVSTGNADLYDVLFVLFVQGVLGGAVALVTFGAAVRLLGASRTAAFTALTPVIVLISGVVFLGEPMDEVKIAGVLIVSFGVLFASGVIEDRAA